MFPYFYKDSIKIQYVPIWWNYFRELCFRFLLCLLSCCATTIILCIYKEQVIYLLGNYQHTIYPSFIVTSLPDVIYMYFKLAIYTSFHLNLPIIFLNFWFFIKPSLYQYEAKKLKLFIQLLILLYTLLFFVIFRILVPICWEFFLSFEVDRESTGITIELEATLDQYLRLILKVFISTHIMSFTSLILIINLPLNFFVYFRKAFVFFAILTATLISPPDILSQFCISIFLILCYELYIFKLFVLREYKKRRITGLEPVQSKPQFNTLTN